jgi:glycosyltransferase involved in cell wall biosynthesis
MKVLLVTFSFPPSNTVGAIRVGKLARYLERRGYELRVLTTDVDEDRSLPLEVPKEWVVYTDYRKRRDWLGVWVGRFRSRPPTGSNVEEPLAQDRKRRKLIWDLLRRQYHGMVSIPDQRIDWMRTAIPAGRRLIEEWKPDIIFASGPPFTGLIVAGRLSRAFGIPWLADFRDLWARSPYSSFPAWRGLIDLTVERLTLRNASAVVTISPGMARQLKEIHHKEVNVVLNGYAEEDFPELSTDDRMTGSLTIRYLGSLYSGLRDPSPLFVAIGLLESGLRRQIRVEFFGESAAGIQSLAAELGVADRIFIRPRVPYRTALELQLQADVLLLLQWNDSQDEGAIPAKLFEYLYARRPILFIGYEHGTAAQLVRDRNAGLVSNHPERIRDQLQTWIEDKQAGRFKRLDPSVSRGLSRDEQYQKLERLFAEILHQPMPPQTLGLSG